MQDLKVGDFFTIENKPKYMKSKSKVGKRLVKVAKKARFKVTHVENIDYREWGF